MVNQELLEYMKACEEHGHLPSTLYDRLISQGWKPKEIKEAMDLVFPLHVQLNKPQVAPITDSRQYNRWQSKLNKYSIFDTVNMPVPIDQQPLPTPPKAPNPAFSIAYKAVAVLLVIGLAVFASTFISKPICGDGVLDASEDSTTCCLDAGCGKGYICHENACIPSPCGDCQYLENGVCIDHECCSDADCFSDETCTDHMCVKVACGPCQYVSLGACTDYQCCDDSKCAKDEVCQNHACSKTQCGYCQYANKGACIKLGCCSNEDCNDNDPETVDSCKNPSSQISYCKNEIPPKCRQHEDCNDNDRFTLDICAGQPRRCFNLECRFSKDCDDEDNSTKDVCYGKPGGKCYNMPIMSCRDEDKYCPYHCSYLQDDNCPLKTVDCGKDYDCMTDAAEICGPAVMHDNFEINEKGVLITSTSIYAINGPEKDKCEFVYRIQNISAKFTPELIEALLDAGGNMTGILKQQAEAEKQFRSSEGYGLVCQFNNVDLENMLDRWDNDEVLETDLDSCAEADIVICTNLRLNVSQSTEVNDIMIELVSVNSTGIVVDVNGLKASVPKGATRLINGLKVENLAIEGTYAKLRINCDKCKTGDDFCPLTCKYAFDRDCTRQVEQCTTMTCMKRNSEVCGPSRLTRKETGTVSLKYINRTYEDSIADNGTLCIYSISLGKNDLAYAPALRNRLSSTGLTAEQVALHEEKAKLSAKAMVGATVECKYTSFAELGNVIEYIDNSTLVPNITCTIGANPSCQISESWRTKCTVKAPSCGLVYLLADESITDAGKVIKVVSITGTIVKVSVSGTMEDIPIGTSKTIAGLKVEARSIKSGKIAELAIDC